MALDTPPGEARPLMPEKPLRLLYAIMSYDPANINNEVHEELVDYFQGAGHKVEVLTLKAEGARHRDQAGSQTKFNPTTEKEPELAGNNQPPPVHTLLFPPSNPWRRLLRALSQAIFHYNYFLDLVWGLHKFLQQRPGQFDVVHIEAAYPLGTAFTLAKAFSASKVPLVMNLQGADVMSLPRYDYGYARYRLVRWLLGYTFKRAAAVRPNSNYTAGLAENLGAKPEKSRVILRNIGTALFPPSGLDLVENKQKKAAELRQRYNLNSGPILMAYSRLHPFKGIEYLVKAIPILKEKYGEINLLICGPSRVTPRFGNYRRYLEDLARKADVQEEIIFTGRIEFALSQDYLAAADLLVVPSVVDALNKVATEAAAIGTPSVLTETTGIGPHAAAAGVALLVKPTSEEALAEGILELLNDPVRLAEMGARGPAWASRYSSPRVGEELLELYDFAIQNYPNKSELSGKDKTPRLCYLAYPSSLTLKSANSIQTYSTVKELKKIAPETLVLLPKLPGRPSTFEEVGAVHLWRVPLNFFSNFPIIKIIPWGYLERFLFANEAGLYLLCHRLAGRGYGLIYVRDVICAFWLLVAWRKLLGAQIVYEAHDLEAQNPSRARARWLSSLLRRIDKTLLSQAGGVVSLTGVFKTYLNQQKWRNPNFPTEVIPDAYDAGRYYPRPQAACREELNLPENEFSVVYAGLTFAYRSLDKLVEAFGQFLREAGVPAKLYLVGGRPFEIKELEEVVCKAGLREKVVFTGQVNQTRVNLWLNAASITVIPDTVTGITASPLKMFEYAAVARPILLPDLPALKEILGENEAIYFERGNFQTMAEGLDWAHKHPAEAAQRGEAARRRVKIYTYQNRAKAILDFVRSI